MTEVAQNCTPVAPAGSRPEAITTPPVLPVTPLRIRVPGLVPPHDQVPATVAPETGLPPEDLTVTVAFHRRLPAGLTTTDWIDIVTTGAVTVTGLVVLPVTSSSSAWGGAFRVWRP